MSVKAVTPVFIDFTHEGEEALGLSRPTDKVLWAGDLERSPEEDNFIHEGDDDLPDTEICDYGMPKQICAAKMPSSGKIIKWLGTTTAILEGGKKMMIAFFDIFDTYNDRTNKGGSHKLMAVQLPYDIQNSSEDKHINLAA